MKKNIVKIILDIVMALLLVLMYSKNVISMTFHELGGLIACGIFIIHLALNRKWIVGVTKRFIDKTLPAKTRIGYVVNVLLLFSIAFIAVSGIMISKALFPGSPAGGGFWKTGHYFAAASALVLVGIHLGLHWPFIKGMLGKLIKLPRKIARPAALLLLVVIIAFGAYNLTTAGFARWLSAPFAATGVQGGDFPGVLRQQGEMPAGADDQEGQMPSLAAGNQTLTGKGEFSHSSSVSLLGILGVLGTFGSIACLFAVVPVWLERLGKMLKNKKTAGHKAC